MFLKTTCDAIYAFKFLVACVFLACAMITIGGCAKDGASAGANVNLGRYGSITSGTAELDLSSLFPPPSPQYPPPINYDDYQRPLEK